MKVNQFGNRILLLLIAICTFAIWNKALPQPNTSSLSRTVTDTSGAAFSNARIFVSNDAGTQIGRTNLTNKGGSYTVGTAATNFDTTTLGDVQVNPGDGRQVEVAMDVGETRRQLRQGPS